MFSNFTISLHILLWIYNYTTIQYNFLFEWNFDGLKHYNSNDILVLLEFMLLWTHWMVNDRDKHVMANPKRCTISCSIEDWWFFLLLLHCIANSIRTPVLWAHCLISNSNPMFFALDVCFTVPACLLTCLFDWEILLRQNGE